MLDVVGLVVDDELVVVALHVLDDVDAAELVLDDVIDVAELGGGLTGVGAPCL